MGVRSSRRRVQFGAALLAVGTGVALILPATDATAVPPAQVAGVAPAIAAVPLPVRQGAAADLGAYAPSQTIRLAIGLRTQNKPAEQAFLSGLQDKSSPEFHQYLTPAAWTARFGPSADVQQAVVSWARNSGLTVTHLFANRLVVDVAGSVANVEKALGVQINAYRLGAQSFFANDRVPVIPQPIAGVIASVDGLSSLQTMHPATGEPSEPASPAYVAGPAVSAGPHAAANGSRAALQAALRAHGAKPNITSGAYDPTDIYSSQAYDYGALSNLGHCCNPLNNPNNSPAQTSIAIATFGSQDLSDMVGFQKQYPYLAYNVQEINIDGTPQCCDAEGTMDMEWSTATSNSFSSFQNTSKVYVYDGANFNDATFTDMYNQMVTDNKARVFSTSWSCTEIYGCGASEMSTQDAIFSEMVGQGWTLAAASGDRGAYDDCAHLAVSFPASDPNVVGAGGTELALSSGPTFASEKAWSGGLEGCENNDGGSGGGCSSVFGAPNYQASTPCGSGSRAVPDISLNADWFNTPQNIFFNGTLEGNGGTSIVAPELAGFFAQENAYLLAAGSICGLGTSACAPLGNANYPIYETGSGSAPHQPFYDTTSGCNSNDVGTGYCAGNGYDLVTGWGSANMLQLAWAFNWRLFADEGRPSVTFTGPTPSHWYNTDQLVGITVADSGGPSRPASGVAGFSDAWNADPGDPTSEPTPGAGNSFYSGPEFPNATSGSVYLSDVGQGCGTLNVQAWDNMGLQSGDVTDGPLCYDTVAPTITAAPTVKIQNHGGPVGAKVPVTVQWSGTDATSGVNHYVLGQSTDGGAFARVTTTPATSVALQLAPGHTYKYRVTATDNAGNSSLIKVGLTYRLSVVQENASTVKYSAGWTRQALSGADGGDVDFANVAGKTATFTFSGVQVAWVSTLGTTRGSATVQLDSATPLTVSTNATATKTANVVDVVPGASGAHKLVIKVLGTAGHPRVDVDAFIVLTTT